MSLGVTAGPAVQTGQMGSGGIVGVVRSGTVGEMTDPGWIGPVGVGLGGAGLAVAVAVLTGHIHAGCVALTVRGRSRIVIGNSW